MADQQTIQQLTRMLAEQQALVTQLMQQQNRQPAQFLPALPDIECFDQDGHQGRSIADWLDRFQFAVDCATPGLLPESKLKLLMTKLSEPAFSEYTKSCLPQKVTDFSFDETLNQLKALFAKPQSIWIDRYECLRAAKDASEDLRLFINRHKKLLRDFEFKKLKEEQFNCLMLLTALKSANDSNLRKRILAKLAADGDTVKYDSVVEDLQMYLSTISEANILEQQQVPKKVFAVNKKSQPKSNGAKSNPAQRIQCWRCGKDSHRPTECSHVKTVCRKCTKTGHLESQCDKHKEWLKRNAGKGVKKVNNVFLGGVLVNSVNQLNKLIEIPVKLNGKAVHFVLDSGAEVTVINEEAHRLIGKPRLTPFKEQARYHDGSTCTLLGRGEATFQLGGRSHQGQFYVCKKGSLNLLGIDMLDAFGLMQDVRKSVAAALQINQIKRKESLAGTDILDGLQRNFPEVFRPELGHCRKAKAHLELKPDASPVFCRPRPAPYNTRSVVEAELKRLEEMDVIKPVDHTRWAAPIVVVKKANGSARVCADFSTGLNNALLLHQHPLPLPEDIFATLNGGRVFTQIDLRDAYLQVELDEKSKELCTIATHLGNFQYQRLPFGVKSAPGIFQAIMDNMLAGLSFAVAYLDDVIVVSKNPEEHRKHLEEVFHRIEQFGFRVKPEKCSFYQKQIKYLGFIVDKDGRRPDPAKIQAISDMPVPTDVSTLRSFLGMINHYQQFVKNMRFIRQPLDDLLKQDAVWAWSSECQEAFEKIIKLLNSDQLLAHYDPSQEIIVSADASEHGIGAVISHRFSDGSMKAVAHASCSLSSAEKNYSQIEKEGLALIYAVKKFHKYLYGRHFVLQTDHKPLLTIFGSKKGIKACSANRLQRWALTLLAYDFEIEYQNTLDFGQADALSRLIAKTSSPEDDVIVANLSANSGQPSLNAVLAQLPLSFADIVKVSEQDETIQAVMKCIRTHWPHKKEMSEDIVPFHRRQNELTIVDGCLLFADRVVVPEVLRKDILQLLHKGHPGMKRMKSLARLHVYWPQMDQQIEDMVRSCAPCAAEAKQPVKTELHSWPKAEGPWKRVHMDYAGPFFGKMYLVVVDSFSKWPEIFAMSSTGSTATIDKLRYLFARHGIPETLVSDNGTQFASKEFKEFTMSNGIEHLFSAPYNPMSNGQAERFVDTFKRTCRKLKGEGASHVLDTFLATYRTTLCDSLPDSKSPAEVFLGRKPRTTLDLLRPKPRPLVVRDEAMERQFNRRHGAKPRSFELHAKVFARHRLSQPWRPGTVSDCRGVMYTIAFPDGSTGKFHANQLLDRHTDETDQDQLEVFYDDFGLPVAKEPAMEPEAAREPEVVAQQQPAPEMERAASPPAQERRRNPERNRRPPRRYSPG